jgi:hypothetical protein
VDHLFRANARFALAEDDGAGVVEVEEVNVETLGLSSGLKLKAGRFLSGVGYLNQQHPHEWDFADAPLAYKAFFGYRLQNDGVQLRWVAPTDLFLELGTEVASGQKFPGAERNRNGAGLWTAFAHLGGDIGTSSAWQVGLSHVRTNPRERGFEDGADATGTALAHSFSGRSQTWIADFVYKWAPNGNSSVTNLKVQGEYFQRRETGDLNYDVGGLAEASFGGPIPPVRQLSPGGVSVHATLARRVCAATGCAAARPIWAVSIRRACPSWRPTTRVVSRQWWIGPRRSSRVCACNWPATSPATGEPTTRSGCSTS